MQRLRTWMLPLLGLQLMILMTLMSIVDSAADPIGLGASNSGGGEGGDEEEDEKEEDED